MKPPPALAEAELYTFSSTRGTTSSTEGLKDWMSGSRFLMEGENPRTPWPARTTCMTRRASTWATGRKSSSRVLGESMTLPRIWRADRHVPTKFAWVSATPLGAPVVPEV